MHEDPDLFRAAVGFTASETGFSPRLIEKDYFCTVLLKRLAGSGWIFRGGTCLAKVHAGFFRLSEDLDFLLPMPVDASRAERSRGMAGSKRILAGRHPPFRVLSALRGANGSSQYLSALVYGSLLESREETLKVEVGLREPLLTPSVQGEAKTLLLDPVSGGPAFPPFTLPCLSREEALAEKLRAALSRREAAIRDFYDVDHAVRRLDLDLQDPDLIRLVREKLAVPGNAPADVSAARLDALRLQVEAQLKPVLRDRDFAQFDLERAFAGVASLAKRISLSH